MRGRRGRGHIQRLVYACQGPAVEQVFQKFLGANIQFFGEFANGDAFGNRHLARRAGLRRCNDGHGAAARARALPGRVQFALTFLLALVQNGTLPLGRLPSVKRLARLCLRRQFLWERREHSPTPGGARAGPRACRHRAATVLQRAWFRATPTARAARSWRECPPLAGLLWTHRLPRTRAARARFAACVGERSAIPGGKRTAISRRQWTRRSAWFSRRTRSCR